MTISNVDCYISPDVSSEVALFLRAECKYLYRCFFGRSPTIEFVNQYLAAHAVIDGLLNSSCLYDKSIELILLHKLHAIHIEPWLRVASPRHPLTTKLLLIAYIAECDGKHLEFTRQSSGKLIGKFRMLWDLIKCGVNLLHGFFVVKIYGLH